MVMISFSNDIFSSLSFEAVSSWRPDNDHDMAPKMELSSLRSARPVSSSSQSASFLWDRANQRKADGSPGEVDKILLA